MQELVLGEGIHDFLDQFPDNPLLSGFNEFMNDLRAIQADVGETLETPDAFEFPLPDGFLDILPEAGALADMAYALHVLRRVSVEYSGARRPTFEANVPIRIGVRIFDAKDVALLTSKWV